MEEHMTPLISSLRHSNGPFIKAQGLLFYVVLQ